MKLSNFLTLGVQDWLKGLVMAILGAISGVIQGSIEAGNFHFDWNMIWHYALIGAVTYIAKNLVTNNKGQLLTKDVPKP